MSSIMVFTGDKPHTPAQALFRASMAGVGLGGVLVTYLVKYFAK